MRKKNFFSYLDLNSLTRNLQVLHDLALRVHHYL